MRSPSDDGTTTTRAGRARSAPPDRTTKSYASPGYRHGGHRTRRSRADLARHSSMPGRLIVRSSIRAPLVTAVFLHVAVNSVHRRASRVSDRKVAQAPTSDFASSALAIINDLTFLIQCGQALRKSLARQNSMSRLAGSFSALKECGALVRFPTNAGVECGRGGQRRLPLSGSAAPHRGARVGFERLPRSPSLRFASASLSSSAAPAASAH